MEDTENGDIPRLAAQIGKKAAIIAQLEHAPAMVKFKQTQKIRARMGFRGEPIRAHGVGIDAALVRGRPRRALREQVSPSVSSRYAFLLFSYCESSGAYHYLQIV